MLIHILSSPSDSFNSYALVYPFLRYRKTLTSHGIITRVFRNLCEEVKDCDILIVDSKKFRPLWKERSSKALQILESLRQPGSQLVWFNTSDSTGSIQTQVIDLVDRYYKNQLLKDRNRYLSPTFGGRTFTQYYYEKKLVTDSDPFWAPSLSKAQINKLRVSWNLGLNPLIGTRLNPLAQKTIFYLPFLQQFSYRHLSMQSILKKKSNLITARMGTSYIRSSVSYQRQKIAEALKAVLVPTDRISPRKYIEELRSSRYTISPFGWGEICIRDFEAICHGSVLIKPSMRHLDTWPQIYIEGETYLSFSWDLEDFGDLLEILRSREIDHRDLAVNAFQLFQETIGDSTGMAFTNKLLEIITDLRTPLEVEFPT